MSFDLKVFNGDLVLDKGDVSVVRGTDKLVQDILKIALTDAGSNILQPWYGSLINRTLVGSYLQTDIVISVAKTQLQNAIENLKKLQNLQVSSGQKVSADEQLSFIKNIDVSRSSIDFRLFRVKIQVLNRVFGTVNTSFAVTQ